MNNNLFPPVFSYKKIGEFSFYLIWILLVLFGIYFTIRGFDRTIFNPERSAGLIMTIHICISAIALIIGPLQFSNTIRKRWRGVHRKIGWTYVGCVMISVPMAYRLGFNGFCPECAPPFFIWTTLWFFTTVMAVIMAIRKNFKTHKQFMIRSYVLMNGFVFTRIDEFLPFPLPEGPEINRPSMIIWLVWVVPMIITEFWLSWLPSLRERKR